MTIKGNHYEILVEHQPSLICDMSSFRFSYLGVVVVVVAYMTTGSEAGVGAKPTFRAQPSVVDVVALHPLETLAQEPDQGRFYSACSRCDTYRLNPLRANCERFL